VTLAMRYAAMSHTGLLRSGNEDSSYAGPRLLAVADGMGGAAAGEVASAVAIATLAELDEDAPGTDLLAALRTAALGANESLRDMVDGDAALEGMGTTLVAVLFAGSRLGLLHVGDSRCYLLRDGELAQITHDHTLVQSLVDDGRISQDEASTHPQRSLITRALDGRPDVELDLSMRETRVGDRYLLCTDGLTGPVGRRETLQDALELPEPEQAVERLVQLALRGGGPDNITVVVADVVDGAGTATPVVVGAAAESPQPAPHHLAQGSAARAAEMSAPAAAAAAPVARQPTPGRQHGRTALLAVLAVLVLLGGGAATWAYIRSQWYVGVDEGQVSVYRGVSGKVAGVDFSTVQERTGLPAERLTELDRQDLENGIGARDRADAHRIVSTLSDRAMPVGCTAAAPCTPAPSAAPTPAEATASPAPVPSPLPAAAQ